MPEPFLLSTMDSKKVAFDWLLSFYCVIFLIMPKEKVWTLKKAKKYAWDQFSIFIRTRDCLKTTGNPGVGVCITCSRKYDFKKLQAGHFIQGRHNNNLFSERGVHAQCFYCNMQLKGNVLEYRRKIIAMYGYEADEQLEAAEKVLVKYILKDYLEIADKYIAKTKALLEPSDAGVDRLIM